MVRVTQVDRLDPRLLERRELVVLELSAKIPLQKSNITEVILYLGACDKNRQDHLLPIFTGEDSTDAARHGAGV